MSFLLTVIFTGALIYLWRRIGALELQLQHIDQTVDALYFRPNHDAVEDPSSVGGDAAAPEGHSVPVQPIQEEESNAQAVEEIPEAANIAAKRIEPAEAHQSEPAEKLKTLEASPYEGDAEEPSLPRFSIDFEDFFGRLLPIWAGGVTLAVAGFFLVRYSIEQGLLGPQVRVALGFLFGGAMLGAAELAYRNEHRIEDPRVRQALAGAGLATLYASFYFAGSQYDLIGSAIAFLGLAGVTLAAILLSFRFGLPSAILGLIGGFAAPMLVSSDNPNLPLLALYLALVTSGLTYAGNRQGRSWLALAALAGGIGWGALILFSGVTGQTDIIAFGSYIVVLGAILPAFTKVETEGGIASSRVLRLGAAALAAIQMGVMVAQSGFSLLGWGLYTLLAAALIFFAWREPRLREASAFAASLVIVMLGIWPSPSVQDFILVGGALLALFGFVPLANIWRGAHRDLDAYQLSGFSLGLIFLSVAHLNLLISKHTLAPICLAIASLPALASWRQWPTPDQPVVCPALVTLITTSIGIIVAGLIVVPLWASPLIISAVAVGLIALTWNRDERGLSAFAWTISAATAFALIVGRGFEGEAGLLAGVQSDVDVVRALVRWSATALPFIALAFKKSSLEANNGAQVIASMFVYGIAAQIAPDTMLAWIAAGLAILTGRVALNTLGMQITFALLTFAWSLELLFAWIMGAALAAVNMEPMLFTDEISLSQIGLRMLPLLAVAASLLIRRPAAILDNLSALIVATGLVAAITAHMGFKHIFAIETAEQFAMLGLAERTVWQGLLLLAGILVARFASEKSWSRPACIALYAGALAHFALFTLFWHNPLWDEQAVGELPVANLLLPAYSVAICATILLKHLLKSFNEAPYWLFDAILMGLLSLLALSELRQLFAGSDLISSTVGSNEDLLRSVLGIALALGFLLWGARVNSRSWRIGSLVLMIAAVLKVFIFDASGLDGLLRVASFIALGLSLIGIGWFYTRQLANIKGDPVTISTSSS